MKKNWVITIARNYGSGGRDLAKELSKELDIPFYDRDIAKLASEQSGIAEHMFGEVDERIRKVFVSYKGKYQSKPLPPEDADFTSDDNLFELEAEVIKKLANEGNCIIVGRCANYILRDRDNVISIYFYASEKDCIKRLDETIGGGEEWLKKKKARIDKHRADYYRYYTGRDWTDLSNYDICINTAPMTHGQLVEIVKKYIELKES